MSFENKPFTITLLVGLGVAILVIMGYLGYNNWGNWFENIDYLRQKMAPAFNETTGFLVISYAVIICIGNVIMKTSPKHLASGGESQEEKTTGFVAWLQSKGLGWLPIFISVTVVSLMTFLPINNKILKIGIIAIVLGGVLVAALFFNAIIKLFGGKESFTDVKEEFGHIVKDDQTNELKPHNLKITVQVRDTQLPHLENIKNKEKINGSHFVDIKNDSGGGHSRDWSSVSHSEYNGIEIGNNGWSTYIDLDYIAPFDKYDVYYSTEVANKPGFLTSLKKLTDKTKQIDVTEITTQTYYFHLFPKDIKIFSGGPSKDKFVKGAGYTTNENGICTLGGEEKLAAGDKVFIFPPDGIKYDHGTNNYRYTIKASGTPGNVPWTGDGTAKSDNKLDTTKKDDVDVILITEKTLEDSPKTSSKFSIKNMQQFFGFDANAVKDSVTDSYIAYYCLVWGSLLVYTIVNTIQKGWVEISMLGFSIPINIPKNLWPFIVAAAVETLLIGQSHYSLNESDVASKSGKASPTFSYAVAGFATRIATVAAFLSSILTQVKD